MKKLLFLTAVLCVLKVNAQDWLITFEATGATTSLATVQVENLTAGTSLTLNGSDILHLTVLTGINSIGSAQSSKIKIYPNPMNGNSVLQISPPVAGESIISVVDMAGKLVYKIPVYLENQTQEFTFSGLKSGFYLISVKGSNYQYSGKLLSNNKGSGTISLEKITNNKAIAEKKTITDSKGELATVDMNYIIGDRLKFTGKFEKYSTVKMDIPASSKTITFNFIACRDEDNNLYSIVEIGTQVWMAENLKTTLYNDNTSIPLVIDNTAWTNLATPGYCWYNNDINYKNTYGALYNWYTINTGTLCPLGWHVPTIAEWATLINYLGGFEVAGGKLKETGFTHWNDPNTGATNETGFTALPGNNRSYTGNFSPNQGVVGQWWSSTSNEAEAMYNYNSRALVITGENRAGSSVRCVKD